MKVKQSFDNNGWAILADHQRRRFDVYTRSVPSAPLVITDGNGAAKVHSLTLTPRIYDDDDDAVLENRLLSVL